MHLPIILAILIILATQGSPTSLPVRGQAPRPAVRIAFVRQGNIWLLDGPSGRTVRLTADGHDSAPRWTANGRALLFRRHLGGQSELLQWQPGKGVRRVRDGIWSPDGTAVAFVRTVHGAGAATTVWVARQGRTVRITPIERGFRWYPLAWSPDSGRLALGRFAISPPSKSGHEIPASSASLWLTIGKPGGDKLQRLPMLSGWPDIVFWSPDGRFLTVVVGPAMPCVSCRADGRLYAVISVASGKVVRLGAALGPNQTISWARNGSYVVLSSGAGRETYWNKHLVLKNPLTASGRTLTRDPRWADVEPAVAPDGKQIAFARGRAGSLSTHLTPVDLIASRRVFLMNAGDSQPHRLTDAASWTDEAPVWSPDGQWLLFVRWRRHHHGQRAEAALWAIRADGTATRHLARLDLPPGFLGGFGYYGAFGWRGLFDVAPS